MAKIQLSGGESAGISGNFDIYGTATGSEKVTILGLIGTYKFDASFNRGGDTISLPGSIFEWQIKRSGSSAVLAKDGISVNLPVGVTAANITFDNASEPLHIDVASGKIYLGSTALQANFSQALVGGHSPQFQNLDTVLVDEGSTGALRAIAFDEDSNSLITYSLPETADNHYFAIDPASGAIRLKSAATYNPDHPNYTVTVIATDDTGLTASHTVSVIIRDRSDNLPAFASGAAAVSVEEGQFLTGYVADAVQADSRDALRYYISGGADAVRFEIDQVSGQLAFKGTPTDYEKPGSARGNNTYEVVVAAEDLSRHSSLQTVTVTVTDKADEASGIITATSKAAGAVFTGSATISCPENQMATGYVGINQIVAAGSYSFSIGGADVSRFWINPGTGALYFRSGGADFEAHNSAAGTNVYQVTVTATDGAGQKSEQAVTLKVTNELYETNPQKGGELINNTADGGITFFGNSADNLVVGTEKFDDLTGWTGQDYIRALAGDDYLRGDPGDDTLEGGAGNDRLMGNEGLDTALYTCASTQAEIKQEGPGRYTVTTPSEGQDLLPFNDMEFVRFTDCEVNLSSDLTTGSSFWTMASKAVLIGSNANDVFTLSGGDILVDGRGGNDVAYLETSSDPVLSRINGTSWKVTSGGHDYILTNIETLVSNGKNLNLTLNLDTIQSGGDGKIFTANQYSDIFLITAPNQTINNADQNDTAQVLTDNYKTNAQVGTWEYASDVTPLPYWINALLPNGAASFAGRLSEHVVYFAFPDTAPSYLSGSELTEFSKFNDDQRAYVRKVLAYISTVVDLRFVETTDTSRVGTMTFFNTNAAPNLGGYAKYPDWGTPFDMDIVINITSDANSAPQHKAPTTDNWGGLPSFTKLDTVLE
jgi:Ca2+-binding RTX toxin-like protein